MPKRSDSWERRIQRAGELSEAHPFAREILDFYSGVARFQQELSARLDGAGASDLEALLPAFPEFRCFMANAAPEPLRERAAAVAGHEIELLRAFWDGSGDLDPRDAFLARAFLQPYAERRAAGAEVTAGGRLCPVCGRKPVAGVLREHMHGAARSLLCSLCSTEWGFDRSLCAGCGEDRPEGLAYFRSEQFDNVRVDACSNCRAYLKTVDLTRNALAVPLVDEIAALPLDLWAQEQGYLKLERNLLGL